MPVTHSKSNAIKSFINTWVKDNSVYCNVCGNEYQKELMPCCENPQIGTNKTLLKALIEENKMIRENLANDYAANKDMNMRWGIRMLPRLMNEMEKFFMNNYKEKLFNDDKELKDFMRAYPYLCIPKKI